MFGFDEVGWFRLAYRLRTYHNADASLFSFRDRFHRSERRKTEQRDSLSLVSTLRTLENNIRHNNVLKRL